MKEAFTVKYVIAWISERCDYMNPQETFLTSHSYIIF